MSSGKQYKVMNLLFLFPFQQQQSNPCENTSEMGGAQIHFGRGYLCFGHDAIGNGGFKFF